MAEALRVIDLFSGLGGRALGFQKAGYDIVCAVDEEEACQDVCIHTLTNCEFILSNPEMLSLENLPKADIITAKLFMRAFKGVSRNMIEKRENEAVSRIIFEKMPKAFVLEFSELMLIRNNSAELKKVLDNSVFSCYDIYYEVIEDSVFSGFPAAGKQVYMVGIRKDLWNGEFYFPQGRDIKSAHFLEAGETVNLWYRRISFSPDIELKTGHYYVRKNRTMSESKIIHNGAFKEMFLMDDIGLRRFTHNEYAALKGLGGYDFNKCKNKYDMYRKLAGASNVYVCKAIAAALSEYFYHTGSEHYVPVIKEQPKAQETLAIKKIKKLKQKTSEAVSDDIIYPKHRIVSIHIDELKGIKNLDISIEKNLTAIMGVNGAGKSTVLHALACIYRPYKSGENYKFPFFFTPNPDSSWKNSRLSVTYRDENLQKEVTRVYKKDTDRWSPRYTKRPERDTYFIGIETCMPDIEKERQTSYIDYKTHQANDKNSRKIVEDAAYILNMDYDNLNYHVTKKRELLGVHTKSNRSYSSLSMGAGEQRVLRILKAVYTANTYSLILIDEIDILLHITALKRLISKLAEIAAKRNLQIIFTTHSIEMSKMQDLVDIRYLEPLKEKTMVYDRITSDIVYKLSEENEKPIKIFVEDILAETVVKVVADALGMRRNIKIVKIGASGNAFVLAASFILQGEDTSNTFILLDGDVYRDETDKRKAVAKVLSGTEKNHEDRIGQAVGMIRQLSLPEKTAPEKFIFDMLIELDNKDEITEIARGLKAVSDSHQWMDKLIERLGEDEPEILYKIVSMVSDNNRWETYVREVREWMFDRKQVIMCTCS